MPDSAPARLLIVDDEAAQMKALCDTLQEAGYSVEGFTAPEKALEALRAEPFDVVLTDLMMPEMDGIGLLRAAQSIDPNVACVVMTGHGTIDTAVEAMKAGALDYILKPFKLKEILPVLKRALTIHQLRCQNKELEQRIRQRTAELETANKDLEAFSYSVSHDLRAPLRHIQSFAAMLGRGLGDTLDEKNRHYLDTVNRTADQMQRLIDALLTFSKMGRVQMNPRGIDLNRLVDEAIQGFETELAGRNVTWKRNSLPRVQGDAVLLKQVFVNLLSNAIKYTRPRNPASIEIGTEAGADGDVVIFIRDNGVGFDAEYAHKLFGVFQRLHHASDFEGIGIGLANVQRIVTRHGGRVWAQGRVDQGATFFVSLKPEHRGTDDARPAAAS